MVARPLGGYVFAGGSLIRFAVAYLVVTAFSVIFEAVRERVKEKFDAELELEIEIW